ncbi:MAG: PASTA domain-containing protein [Clostridia bacterium]|nr:PASTA domain-containing protein [Clostridia bacterium]
MKKNSSLKTQKRILWLAGTFLLLFLLLAIRVAYIQFIDGGWLAKEAIEQQTRDRMINAKRGTIYDRNGKQLAVSADVETVSLSPITVRENGDPQKCAEALSDILGLEKESILEKINMNTSYVLVKRKVEKEQADAIRAAGLTGVYLDADTKRYYPYNNIASHIIGFTGTDNQGLLGIEQKYDNILKGQYGRIVTARNADGTEMPYKYDRYYTPEDGSDITLTIDVSIQHFLEKHLEQALTDLQLGNGAAGIIMDVKTGEILAMATKPDFNLNEPFLITDPAVKQKIDAITDSKEKGEATQEYLNKLQRNKAVIDSYEPGSTFKIITSAMALEENVVSLQDTFNCTGSYKVAKETIGCWKHAGHGILDLTGALMNSCNPAFMQIGARIGQDTFYKYYKGFGFTEKTGIELYGETSGLFYPAGSFNEVELATASFGQGPVVTPLQMITAVSAVANDGKLMKPHLLKNITDASGTILQSFDPEEVRQVISPQTSQIMRSLMEAVVSEGTGNKAYLEGFRIGGKTGTSEKIPRGNQKYVASFVGIAPANDPQVAILLLLDEPPAGNHMGGTIASPLAGKILDDVLRYLDIEPEVPTGDAVEGDAQVPHVSGMNLTEARQTISQSGLRCVVEGNGSVVTAQVPNPGVTIARNGTVIVYTGDARPSNSVQVPSVIGKSFEEAKSILEKAKFQFHPVGIENTTQNALAQTQSIQPGEYATIGSEITVEFSYQNSTPVTPES